MLNHIKTRNSADDAAMIAPDYWSGKRQYTFRSKQSSRKKIVAPSFRSFYCSEKALKLVVLSDNQFFIEGLKYVMQGVENFSADIIKNGIDTLYCDEENTIIIIASIENKSDIINFYSLRIKLKLAGKKTHSFIFPSKELEAETEQVAVNMSNVESVQYRPHTACMKSLISAALKKTNANPQCSYIKLTLMQKKIIQLSSTGTSVRDIARNMGVSESLVYYNKKKILDGAGAINHALEAVLYRKLQGANAEMNKVL